MLCCELLHCTALPYACPSLPACLSAYLPACPAQCPACLPSLPACLPACCPAFPALPTALSALHSRLCPAAALPLPCQPSCTWFRSQGHKVRETAVPAETYALLQPFSQRWGGVLGGVVCACVLISMTGSLHQVTVLYMVWCIRSQCCTWFGASGHSAARVLVHQVTVLHVVWCIRSQCCTWFDASGHSAAHGLVHQVTVLHVVWCIRSQCCTWFGASGHSAARGLMQG